MSSLKDSSRVLDVGCGIGGTSRYLASTHGCTVTGITISPKQVEIANRLTASATEEITPPISDDEDFQALKEGKVRVLELDAEKMAEHFAAQEGTFDAVWISEALSHFPNKSLFFENARRVLKDGGKLVLADWFKDESLDAKAFEADIKPIEGTYPP
jgi:tocopherol O-methyltransferase